MVLAVLAAVAEMERDLLVERTQSGLARAKAEGKALGRPTKTTARDQVKIVELHAADRSLSQIAAQFGIGKATVHAVVKAARMVAQVPAPTTTGKVTKTTGKAAAGRVSDYMADRMTLEQKHGQRRLPAV